MLNETGLPSICRNALCFLHLLRGHEQSIYNTRCETWNGSGSGTEHVAATGLEAWNGLQKRVLTVGGGWTAGRRCQVSATALLQDSPSEI